MFWLAVVTFGANAIGLLITLRAANAAKDSANAATKTAGLAESQGEHLETSVKAATASAAAMGRIADALTQQGDRLDASIAMQREMLRDQRQVAILQNRARLQIIEWKVFRVIDEYPHQAATFTERDCAIRLFGELYT